MSDATTAPAPEATPDAEPKKPQRRSYVTPATDLPPPVTVGLHRLMARQAAVPPYTELDIEQVEIITTWLNRHGQSRAWLGRITRISGATVSTVLNGRYPSSPTQFLSQMLAAIDVEEARLADGTPDYVEGSVHKLVRVVCDRTRKYANFGVICGQVGVGKTRTLREYADRVPQTMMLEANPRMTVLSLMQDVMAALAINPVPSTTDGMFRVAVKALTGTNYLIIMDEAEKCRAQSLEYLRRLRDKARVGVVLAGTPELHTVLKAQNGQFNQIRSRISMWPKTIDAITRDDADELARTALADAGELPDDVLDALWAYGQGSARVLMEGLLPGLRDFGVGRKPLTAALVDAVARDVLFMAPRAAAKGRA